MRILHVHDQAGFHGGVEQILFDTAHGLAAAGWEQGLLTASELTDSRFAEPFRMIGRRMHEAAAFRPDAVLMHKVSDPRRAEAIARLFPAAHMVHDHDLVCPRRHKYTPLDGRICDRPAGASCFANLCFVQKAPAGSAIPIRLEGTSGVRRLLRASGNVRKFLVGSAYMRRELAMNGIPAEKVCVLPPVPASATEPFERPRSIEAEILFVGQVIRGKGVDLLLRACARLQGEWHLTVVGDGNHLPYCRQLSAELDLSGRVEFTGWVEHGQLERFYSRARLVAVPSRWPEPFGMVGVEAMARGRAVVGFSSGGIPDWLDDGVTGLLVPSGDVNSLAVSVQRLLDRPELAATLGQAGVTRVASKFSHHAYLEGVRHHLGQLQ